MYVSFETQAEAQAFCDAVWERIMAHFRATAPERVNEAENAIWSVNSKGEVVKSAPQTTRYAVATQPLTLGADNMPISTKADVSSPWLVPAPSPQQLKVLGMTAEKLLGAPLGSLALCSGDNPRAPREPRA